MTNFPQGEPNKVRIYSCKSWTDFIDKVGKDWPLPSRKGVVTADLVLFRGHVDPEWKLWSRLERNLVMYGKDQDGTIHMFAARKRETPARQQDRDAEIRGTEETIETVLFEVACLTRAGAAR
jgi:hypothetical protein